MSRAPVDRPNSNPAPARPTIWIVEDEPPAAELAAELCTATGAEPSIFRSALPFLRAFREAPAPQAIVLDWRLEHELSAALFMATRHRFPRMPVIYWTGSASTALPSMIRDDPCTQVIDKAGGAAAFEAALTWAISGIDHPPNRGDAPMGMNDAFKIPKDPHPGEPDELTPDTAPIDDIERPHRRGDPDAPYGTDLGDDTRAKDLDEPGAADRTPRP